MTFNIINIKHKFSKQMGTCCLSKDGKQRSQQKTNDGPGFAFPPGGENQDQLSPDVANLIKMMVQDTKIINTGQFQQKSPVVDIKMAGTQDQLKGQAQFIIKYRYCFFVYLRPIKEISLGHIARRQLKLKLIDYPFNLQTFSQNNKSLNKYEKYVLMLRVTRAVRYLQRKGIIHNRVTLDNIFLEKDQIGLIPKLGLPFYQSTDVFRNPRDIPASQKRSLVQSLIPIFLTLLKETTISKQIIKHEIESIEEQSPRKLLEDMNNLDRLMSLQEIMKRIFRLNFEQQPIELPKQKKNIIEYSGGVHYQGETLQSDLNVKDGYGIETDPKGNKYYGYWVNNQRSGLGTYVMPDQKYIYIGEWKNNIVHGKGFQLSLLRGNYYEGFFQKGKKNGRGIIQQLDGQIYIGQRTSDLKQGKGIYYDAQDKWAYKGDWKNDTKDGKAEELYANGAYFKGTLINGIKEGQGQYFIPSQYSYKGGFKNNKFEGEGQYEDFKQKYKYRGFYRQGHFQGKGYYRKQQYQYDGQWSNGQRQGYGQQKIGKDVRYKGLFKANTRHGKGQLLEKGQLFTGTFNQGKYSGEGTYSYEQGDKYEGQFVNKKKDGYGVYISAEDGSRYQGEWKQDLRHGKGKYLFKNGGYYEGRWVQGKREGPGKQYFSDNNNYDGLWSNDKKDGLGKQIQISGNVYEGQFKQGLKHGKGKLVYANSDVYEGIFAKNMHNGHGTYSFKNGDKYVGDWVNGNREGKGRLTKASGQYYEGAWKDNKKNGFGKEVYKNKAEFYQGEFKDDMKDGKGALHNIKYGKLECTWIKNRREGLSIFTFKDGTVEEREYKNNIEINLHASPIKQAN